MKRLAVGCKWALVILTLSAVCAPAETEDWFARGIAFMQEKRYDEAIHAFTLTIEVVPHDFQAYNNRGSAWFQKGEYARAAADYTQALKFNPDYAKAFHNRGSAYFYQQSYHEALSDYSRAIELDPQYAEAYFNRGSVWLKIGRREKALDDIRRAQQIDPQHPTAGQVLALLTSESGQSLPPAEQTGQTKPPEPADRPQKIPAGPEAEDRGAGHSPEATAQPEALSKSPAASKPVAAAGSVEPPASPAPDGPRPYAIQIASFPHPEEAIQLAEELSRKGRSACSAPVNLADKGWWYRVYVGRYPSRIAAQNAAVALRATDFPGAFATWKPFAVEVLPGDGTSRHPKRLADQLRRRGYVAVPSDHPADRVLIGAFDTRSRARALKEDLKAAGWWCRVVPR